MNKVLLALLIMLTCSIIAPSAKDDSVRVGKVSNVMNVSLSMLKSKYFDHYF